MKLLFLASANSVHSHRWIRYFAEKNHEIHWVSVAHSIDSTVTEMKNVSFYDMSKGFSLRSPFTLFNTIKKIKKILRETKPDVFHVHYAGVNGFLAALCNYHQFIVTAWGSDVLIAGRHFWKKFLVSFILQTADLITCDAEHMKKAIMNFGIPESKIRIIQFGIDTKKFTPGLCDDTIKRKIGVPSGCQTVISMRNFEPVYDIETLLRAVPAVLKSNPRTMFLLGGRGSQKEYLENLSEELGIKNSVVFLGFIPNTDLPCYLRCADVYVSTSLSDAGIASSTAEAMACGIPVVITDSGENALWIKDGEDGYLVPVKNSTLLAEKIVFLLESPEEQKRIGQNGRKVIEERDDYWNEMGKMDALYTCSIHKTLD